tara:strand:+ start:259 stop:450 length:192 start_codon:yes stop_codon:yes gene_type:complete
MNRNIIISIIILGILYYLTQSKQVEKMSDGEEPKDKTDFTMFYISGGVLAGVISLLLLYTYLK